MNYINPSRYGCTIFDEDGLIELFGTPLMCCNWICEKMSEKTDIQVVVDNGGAGQYYADYLTSHGFIVKELKYTKHDTLTQE